MPYVQGLLTLTGSAQKLSTATGTYAAHGVTAAALGNLACHEIHMQPDGANSAVVKFGDAAVSSTLYAFSLPAGDTGDAPAPMIMGPHGGEVIKLGDMYALGTAGEKVHIGLVI